MYLSLFLSVGFYCCNVTSSSLVCSRLMSYQRFRFESLRNFLYLDIFSNIYEVELGVHFRNTQAISKLSFLTGWYQSGTILLCNLSPVTIIITVVLSPTIFSGDSRVRCASLSVTQPKQSQVETPSHALPHQVRPIRRVWATCRPEAVGTPPCDRSHSHRSFSGLFRHQFVSYTCLASEFRNPCSFRVCVLFLKCLLQHLVQPLNTHYHYREAQW